jgi:hypothetical protein
MTLGSPVPPPASAMGVTMSKKCGSLRVLAGKTGGGGGGGTGVVFPSFLPKEVEKIKDPFSRTLAQRIERLPVQVSFFPLVHFFFFSLGVFQAWWCFSF